MPFYILPSGNFAYANKPWEAQAFRGIVEVGTDSGQWNPVADDYAVVGTISTEDIPIYFAYIPSVADATLAFDVTLGLLKCGVTHPVSEVDFDLILSPAFFATALSVTSSNAPEDTNLQRLDTTRTNRTIGSSLAIDYTSVDIRSIDRNTRWHILLKCTAIATGATTLDFKGFWFRGTNFILPS